MSEETTTISSTTLDGFTVSDNVESAEDMKRNLSSDPKPLDGDPDEAKRKADSEAASRLGKKGAEAAAKAREAKDEEADDEQEQDEPAKGKDEPEKRPNPRHDARARVQEATRKLAEERRAREALEARLAALEADRARPEPTERKAAAAQPGGKPTPDQFESYDEFVEALADYKAEERLKRDREQTAHQQEAEKHASAVGGKVESFRKRLAESSQIEVGEDGQPEVYVDGQPVDRRLLELKPSFMVPPDQQQGPQNALADEIIDSQHTSKLLRYFSDNEQEVRRILALPSARDIARAVAVLESKLTSAPAKQPEPEPQFSKARPPLRPVTPSAQVGEDDLGDDADFDAHYRVMQAREQRARRAR